VKDRHKYGAAQVGDRQQAQLLALDQLRIPGRGVRLSPAITGCLWGIRTEVVGGEAFWLLTDLPSLDCNPSRKLRRFESFTCHRVRERASDLRKRSSEALFIYPMGVSNRCCFWRSSGLWVARLDLRKHVNRIGRRWVRPEYAWKFGSTPPCWPDSPSADLRGRWG